MRGHACEETGRFVRGGQACGGRQAVEGVGLWGEACREEQLGGGELAREATLKLFVFDFRLQGISRLLTPFLGHLAVFLHSLLICTRYNLPSLAQSGEHFLLN